MRRSFFITIFAVVTFTGTVFGVYKGDTKDIPPVIVECVEDELIVVVKEDVSALIRNKGSANNAFAGVKALETLGKKFGVTRVKAQFPKAHSKAADFPTEKKLSRYYKVRFGKGKLEDAMLTYAEHPMVERVEYIGIHGIYIGANDPYYKNPPPEFPYDQWHYWDTFGIDTEGAWDLETGSPDVVVGILDTGVRYFHTDLGGNNPPWEPDNPQSNGNIWINPGEIPGNGIDDDGNGYKDDAIGWDFVDAKWNPFLPCIDQDCRKADNDPDDGEGHGTHLAGTVAATTNNDRAVAGIAGGYGDGTQGSVGNGVKILPLRIGYRVNYLGIITGVVRMDWAAEAMYYVADQVDRGVNVAAINCSWGSSDSGGLSAAVDNLLAHDVMIVVAAGNSGSSTPDYLGSRGDCMDVAATNPSGSGASLLLDGFDTNYGPWVDVAAPGVDIVSTYREPTDPDPTHNYIAVLSGTSMAAPHVVGIAALLESYKPNLSSDGKFQKIVNNTIPYRDIYGHYLGSGIANAALALQATGDVPPQVTITNPIDGDTVSGLVTVTADAMDDLGVTQLEFFVEGVSIGIDSNGSDGWSANWDTTLNADGPHTITATATDTIGQTGSDSIGVIVDNIDEPPTASIVNPADGDTVSGVVIVQVYATDAEDAVGTLSVEVCIDSATGGAWQLAVYNSTSGYYELPWDTTGLVDGSLHTIDARAADSASNITNATQIIVIVDNSAATTMHVDSIVVSTAHAGKGRKKGQAQVVIKDDKGNPAANASVTGTFYDDISEIVSANTDSNGLAVLTTTKTKKGRCHLTFCVDNVTHSSLTYNSDDNIEDCDSNY